MEIFRVCLAQINSVVGDLNGNANKIIEFIAKAKNFKADIVAFPELCLSGYPPEDLLLKPYFIKSNREKLFQIVKTSDSILSIVGLPYLDGGKLFNAAALIYNGKLLDVYKKVRLPNYGVFDEKRYFYQGDRCHVLVFGQEVKIGINICEDIWYSEGPQRTQTLLGGAKAIINISASPYHAQKIELRKEMLKKRAKENNAFILYCNLVGSQDELVFDGGSLVFDNRGRLMARGKQFEEDLIIADLDLNNFKGNLHSKKKAHFILPKSSLKYHFLPKPKEKETISLANKVEKKFTPLDEIYSALVLGVRDYVRKNKFEKVVLGLSGGIDSALTVVLAVDALGKENVIALTMPSEYSSRGTQLDARQLTHNLGIQLITLPIREIYKKYLSLLKPHFRRYKSDVTEENIQARIRGNLIMAFSNKFGWLVITTGNKSEVSTGYCTLYGDMAGGFAVLKDVPKGLVYKLAKHRNTIERKDIIPQSIFRRAPSAELKKGQKDQDTLPPYSILDDIINMYVERDNSAQEIINKGLNKEIVYKIVSIIDRNEYKRRQAPPGIKITPKAFGKDRRMPITNLFSG